MSTSPDHYKFLPIALLLFLLAGYQLPGSSRAAEHRLRVLLPKTFLKQNDTPSPPITALLNDIGQIQDDYLTTLADNKPFYGLYLRGEYDQDIYSAEESHRIGVEWDFFDLGWNEAVRRVDKKQVETKLQFMQTLANMQQKKLMEKLYLKNMVNSRIKGLINKKKSSVLLLLQKSRKKQFENGYATKDDYLTAYYKYKNSTLLASHYNRQMSALLDKPMFDIINSGESIVLLPVEVLLQQAIDHSVGIQIQNLFIQRSEFFPAWSDDLRLNIYAENVQRRGGNQEQIMGVAFRLPLQINTSRAELVATEQTVYEKQKEAIRKRLAQRIPGIIETLSFHQQRIIIASNEYTLMQQRLADLTTEEQSSIPILDRTPKRRLDLLEIELLDKELEILLARLKVYEELLKLEALVQPKSMDAMFEPAKTVQLSDWVIIESSFNEWLRDTSYRH